MSQSYATYMGLQSTESAQSVVPAPPVQTPRSLDCFIDKLAWFLPDVPAVQGRPR